MLKVFLTVDVEVWCDGWADIDRKFADSFDRYIYGRTAGGEYGLRYQARQLRDHGLRGVFFVEPLFSGRFGSQPLAEVVALLREGGQEVQLHLHTEWLDEWPEPMFPHVRGKRQFMRMFTLDEQCALLAEGRRRLEEAGAGRISAFRAGSFGFNAATLQAVAANGLPFDCSYNATAFGPASGVAPGGVLTDVSREGGVVEYPMTVYDTGFGRLRHVQLGACSWREIERLLWSALDSGQQAFVLLSHNFELLTPSKQRADPIVVARFERLCSFLERHRDQFEVCGFDGLAPSVAARQPPPLGGSAWHSAGRAAEQLYRRRYR